MSKAAVHEVPVEDHVQVLVGGDAGQQLVGDRVAGGPAGVAVRDAGRQLLEGDVGERLERALVPGVVAGGHVVHPGALERDRVDAAGDEQVVADRDAVPALLGRPPAHPLAPGAVPPEPGGDLPVVAGEVVLGQQVGDHRGPRGLVEPGLLRRPVLAAEGGEVAPLVPRDVVVRVPLLGHRTCRSRLSATTGSSSVRRAVCGEVGMGTSGSGSACAVATYAGVTYAAVPQVTYPVGAPSGRRRTPSARPSACRPVGGSAAGIAPPGASRPHGGNMAG